MREFGEYLKRNVRLRVLPWSRFLKKQRSDWTTWKQLKAESFTDSPVSFTLAPTSELMPRLSG